MIILGTLKVGISTLGYKTYTSMDDEYLHDAILNPPVAPASGIARQAIVINVTSCPYKGE